MPVKIRISNACAQYFFQGKSLIGVNLEQPKQIKELLKDLGVEPKSIFVIKEGRHCSINEIITNDDEILITIPFSGG